MHHQNNPYSQSDIFTKIISLNRASFMESPYGLINQQTFLREDIASLPFPTITLCLSDNYNHFKYQNFPGNISEDAFKKIFSVIHGHEEPDADGNFELFDSLNIDSYEQLVKSIHLTMEDVVLNNISLLLNHHKPCSFSKEKCTLEDLRAVWMLDGTHSCIQFNPYNPRKEGRAQTIIFSPFRMYLDLRSGYNRGLVPRTLHKYHLFNVMIHEYGIPHHVYTGKNFNTLLFDRFFLNPGKRWRFYLDRQEVSLVSIFVSITLYGGKI